MIIGACILPVLLEDGEEEEKREESRDLEMKYAALEIKWWEAAINGVRVVVRE